MICGLGGIQAAVAFALLSLASAARAGLDLPLNASDRRPRVALLSTVSNDPLAGRIDAELHTVGVDVSRAAITPGIEIEEQVRAALRAGARAVVVADGHRTDVWIAQDGSDRIGLRQELEVDETSGLQAVLALRTVEFLRISLGLVSEPNIASSETVKPTFAGTASVAPASKRWMTIDASSGVLASAGGGGVIAIAGVSLRGQLWRLVGLELCLYAPLSETTLTNGDGQARTSAWLAGGGVLLAPRPEGRLSIEVAAGTLATLLRSDGSPSNNTTSAGYTDLALRAAIYGRAAARVRVAPQLSLRIDLLGGAVINPPGINFGVTQPSGAVVTSQVGAWGPGFAAGLGGAELQF